MSTVAELPGDWQYLYEPRPTLGADVNVWNANLTFVTTQANLIPFATILAGVPTTITYSGGTKTVIQTLQHPLYNWMWSSSFDCEMFGEASQVSSSLADLHSHVRINVQFNSPTFPTNGDDPYLTWETRGNSLYATIPGRKMKFSNAEVLGQDAGFFISQVNYVLTLYQAPTLNDTFINTYSNAVNDATFRGIPAGQLRFDTWSSSIQVGSGGVVQYQKQLVFSQQSHPWNQYFRTDGTLDTATDPAGNPTYPNEMDFTQLLGA